MKFLRIDRRLYFAGAILILGAIAFYLWATMQSGLTLRPSQQLTMLRADSDQKLGEYLKARDEYDEKLDAAVNGEWDNPDKMLKAKKMVAPLWERVLKLRDISDDAIEKTGEHGYR